MEKDDAPVRPRWVICEDGTEYLERFTRFLDEHFEFAAATSAAELLAALERPAVGVILDLDFRRTPAAALIDERGALLIASDSARASTPSSPSQPPSPPAITPIDEPTRRRLAEHQGIHILRLLRARGHTLPALLFADLDDAGQVRFLETSCAPLVIVPSSEGLAQTAARMRAFDRSTRDGHAE